MYNESSEQKILIIDDEQPIREVLSASLSDEGYIVETAKDGEDGVAKIQSFKPDVALLDVWMPGKYDGIGVLKIAREKFPNVDFIVMSGHGTIETAVQAVKLGAWDFIEKPISFDKISILLKNILSFQKERSEKKNLLYKLRENIAIVGNSNELKQLKQLVVKLAPSAHWVLVEGERGTGKELVANNIHYLSPRASYSFVDVKCAQVPEDLIEGELFGYEEGTLVGTNEERRGRFDLAHRGTLFFDDIDALDLSIQDKIYRYLQSGKIQRKDGSHNIELDVRVIAGTTKNLSKEVAEGRFHADLYARLNLVPLKLTPLRSRKTDIESLLNYYSSKFASSSGYELKKWTAPALELLMSYEWPGNVKELKNFIERIYILTPEETIDVHDIKFAGLQGMSSSAYNEIGNFRDARAQFEKEYILAKISEYNGNISKTAEAIGLERSYLHRKIKSFGIEIE
ncbi:MAG: sigma-54 dependent transcriptional regulator [Bdellovibrionales bacterium]|nr:sigma-54 dependent transcriptional regulator [Bdellovibrionales bacterium]